MMNQTAKFVPLAIIDCLKGLNGLDCANGPHRNPEIVIYPFGLFFLFSNISKSVINQWLIFDHLAFLGSLNMIIGLGLA